MPKNASSHLSMLKILKDEEGHEKPIMMNLQMKMKDVKEEVLLVINSKLQ